MLEPSRFLILFLNSLGLQSYTCELQQDHRFPNQFFQKVAMDKAPSKRHRSKSAPETESKTKRPSALRKPTVSSSTPAERLQKYLAEKKLKDRASSATSKASSRGASRSSKKDALKKHEKKEKKEKKDVKKKVSGGKAVPVMKVNKGDKFEKSKSKSMSKEDKKKAAVKEQKKGKDVKKGERECSRKTKEDKKVKEDEGRKAETKEKDGRKNQTTETEKKPDQPGTIDKKTKGEAKDTSNKKKGEEKIKFVPSQKKKVEHIFHTPPAKASHSPASASSLTSKQRAEMHLRSLGDLLQASDDDSVSATDMDEFLSEIATQGKKAAADEAKEDKDPQEVEKAKESKDKEESSDVSSNDGDESEGGEDEESEEESPDKDDVSSDLDSDEKVGSGDDLEEDEEDEDDEGEDKDDDEESAEDEVTKDEKEVEKKPEEEGEDKDKAPATEACHALVPATAGAAEATNALRNSTTNKREWDAFCRQLKSGNKIPCQVSEYAQNAANKTCLFGMWLDSGKDWNQCSLTLERTLKQKNESEKGWCAVQGRELKKKYEGNPKKYQKLVESRKKSGLWYPDDDFPDDDEEPRFIYGKYPKDPSKVSIQGLVSLFMEEYVHKSYQKFKQQKRYDYIQKSYQQFKQQKRNDYLPRRWSVLDTHNPFTACICLH